MTREAAIKELQLAQQISKGDPEAGHSTADYVLCEFLTELGYEDVVDEWCKVEKWYA